MDQPFFEAIGGVSSAPSHDLDDGDVVWLVPYISESYALTRGHWEVLSLEASSDRLLAAETMRRADFEEEMRGRLRRIDQAGASVSSAHRGMSTSANGRAAAQGDRLRASVRYAGC